MRNPVDIFFGWLAKKLEANKPDIIPQVEIAKETEQTQKLISKENKEEIISTKTKSADKKKLKKQDEGRHKKPKEGDIAKLDKRDIRDVMEIMEVPFLALSKNRKSPIVYENADGSVKVNITPHTGHYLASIYDWDIVLYVASKTQEILNSGADIPPRTLVVPRNELLKELHKHDGKKEEKDLKASLSRLKLTGVETTIRNEDGRYDSGFGFLDSWGYTDRKDIKEIRITLSQWLYDGICKKGSLLKVSPEYFKITSGIKKFLYRTGRKHVGIKNESWEFLVENLYKKSGSEQEFKKFKYDLKKAVLDDDIPAYFTKWIEKNGKSYIRFINRRKLLGKVLSGEYDGEKTSEILGE